MDYNKYIDNTLLKADATKEQIISLCEESKKYNFKSVCVNPDYIKLSKECLKGSDVLVCTVIGFPLGSMTTEAKIFEAKDAIEKGADEIDMVINISKLKDKENEYVYNEIKKILGLDRVYNLIVIGGGNIGQALVNYTNFERRGLVITAVFDINPRLIGMTIRGVKIYDIEKIEEFISNNKVDVAILTLPRSQACKVANQLASLGVKAIWNFSHVDLKLPEDVIVENVHLTDSLMTLLYKINEVETHETEEEYNEHNTHE